MTEEIVPELAPPEIENETVKPPTVSGFPLVSLVIKVMVEVAPEVIFAELKLTVVFERDKFAGMTLIDTPAEVSAEPSTVAEIVIAVPEVVPVKLAL